MSTRHQTEPDITIEDPLSEESLALDILTTADPTATPSEWQLTGLTETSNPDSWVDGSWEVGSWSGDLRTAVAVTPILTALTHAPRTKYRLWIRWTVGSEHPVRLAGIIAFGGTET